MTDTEILNGMDEIRNFWDPHMTKDCFYRNIRPHLDPILFERTYINRRMRTPGEKPVERYYTFKNLVLSLKLRLEKKNKL